MRRIFGSLAACLALLAAMPGAAQQANGVFYECDMTSRSRHADWVSSKLGIVMLDNGDVVVSDRFTMIYGPGTVSAKVEAQTQETLAISWGLAGGLREDKYLLPDVEYSARLDRADNKLRLKGRFPSKRVQFSGKGSCVIRDQ